MTKIWATGTTHSACQTALSMLWVTLTAKANHQAQWCTSLSACGHQDLRAVTERVHQFKNCLWSQFDRGELDNY